MKRHTEEIVETLEKEISNYFPKKWSEEEIRALLGEVVYDIDLQAVNRNLHRPLSDLINRGGKRLRPTLFLTCLKIFGVNYKKHVDLALFIELIHNGTLVLDDIEDDGLLRRSKPTLHVKYGLDTATNSGFILHVLPLKILLEKKKLLKPKQYNRLWQIYAESMINVGFGQTIDIYWHKNMNGVISVDRYLEMARLKTGSLMRMSIGMACIIAGLNKKSTDAFNRFAESIGLAFQIIDDTLDIVNSDTKFGKAYGNDISEGKISLPIVYAFKQVSDEDKLKLVSLLAKHTREKREIRKALNIIKKSGAIDKSMDHARRIIDDAWHEIDKLFSTRYNLLGLKELTYFFVYRDY